MVGVYATHIGSEKYTQSEPGGANVTVSKAEPTQLATPHLKQSEYEVSVGEEVVFEWEAVQNATEYSIYVWDKDTENEVASNLNQSETSFEYTFEEEGEYVVGVYATHSSVSIFLLPKSNFPKTHFWGFSMSRGKVVYPVWGKIPDPHLSPKNHRFKAVLIHVLTQ